LLRLLGEQGQGKYAGRSARRLPGPAIARSEPGATARFSSRWYDAAACVIRRTAQVMAGEITPDDGVRMLQALQSLAAVESASEIEKRISALGGGGFIECRRNDLMPEPETLENSSGVALRRERSPTAPRSLLQETSPGPRRPQRQGRLALTKIPGMALGFPSSISTPPRPPFLIVHHVKDRCPSTFLCSQLSEPSAGDHR
jgi:hypothetical protein